MSGTAQATATNPARAILAKADAYRSQIASLETQKAAIPRHEIITSDDRVDAECKTGRGPNCLRRETDRELTKRADAIDADIARERQKIIELGPLPKEIDHAAAMMDIGDVGEQRVSKWIVFVYAFIVEGLAFAGPALVVSALSTKGAESPPAPPQTSTTPLPKGERKPSTRKVKEKNSHVGGWREARTLPSPGETVQASDAYQDYKLWCRARRATPLSDKAFFVAMKDDPAVNRIRKNGRFHYADLSLKHQPLLTVVSA
jgi:hypothetical protein